MSPSVMNTYPSSWKKSLAIAECIKQQLWTSWYPFDNLSMDKPQKHPNDSQTIPETGI